MREYIRTKTLPPTVLGTWIDKIGVLEVAKLLRVNQSAVRHWRRGYCLPKTEQMLLIKKYSRGKVSCDKMISQFYSQAKFKK